MQSNDAWTHLDLLEELVPGHLRHPVVSDDHAHVGLLKTQQHVTSSSHGKRITDKGGSDF